MLLKGFNRGGLSTANNPHSYTSFFDESANKKVITK